MIAAAPPATLPPAVPAQLLAPTAFEGRPFEQLIAEVRDLADSATGTEIDVPQPLAITLEVNNASAQSDREICEPVALTGKRKQAPNGDEPADPAVTAADDGKAKAQPIALTQPQVALPPSIAAEAVRFEKSAFTCSLPSASASAGINYSSELSKISETLASTKMEVLTSRPILSQQPVALPKNAPTLRTIVPQITASLTVNINESDLTTLADEVSGVAEPLSAQTPKPIPNPTPVANITAEQWITARVVLHGNGPATRPVADADQRAVQKTIRSAPDVGGLDASLIAPLPDSTKTPTPASGPLATTEISGPPADAIISRHLDFASSDRWLADLASEVASFNKPDSKLIFRLSPENLGQLEVSVSRHDDAFSVGIEAGSDEAQSILSSNLPKLEEELRGKLRGSVDAQIWNGTHTSGQGDRRSPHHPKPVLTSNQTASAADIAADPECPQTSGLFA
jgi:Flagellar hook-length control protein FliK